MGTFLFLAISAAFGRLKVIPPNCNVHDFFLGGCSASSSSSCQSSMPSSLASVGAVSVGVVSAGVVSVGAGGAVGAAGQGVGVPKIVPC